MTFEIFCCILNIIDTVRLFSETAERSRTKTRYLMAIENEGKCPALDVWFRLIRALHISADDIVYPEKTEEKEQDAQLLYMIRSLNSRDKKIAQAAVQAMPDNQ